MNRFAHKHGELEKTGAAVYPGRRLSFPFRAKGSAALLEKDLLSVTAIMPCAILNWGAEKMDHELVDTGLPFQKPLHPMKQKQALPQPRTLPTS
jgi:hypothetical protein